MSLKLTHIRAAKIIQRFYNTYIKAERDTITGLPIDPISRDVIPKERQLKLFITSNSTVCRIQYFDIYNLDTWFHSRGEPINPMTNSIFTNKQLADIRNCYNRVGLIIPNILDDDYTSPEERDEDDENEDEDIEDEDTDDEDIDDEQLQNNILLEHLIYICGDPTAINELRNILYDNAGDNTFDLNYIRNLGHPLISTGTALMNAVAHDNILAVEELLYFNVDLNISDGLFGYKAVDLAIISNSDNSLSILKLLLFHGARLDIPTNFGHSSDLTVDIDKLEIIYTFLDQ